MALGAMGAEYGVPYSFFAVAPPLRFRHEFSRNGRGGCCLEYASRRLLEG
jgi:hypothetical protein